MGEIYKRKSPEPLRINDAGLGETGGNVLKGRTGAFGCARGITREQLPDQALPDPWGPESSAGSVGTGSAGAAAGSG